MAGKYLPREDQGKHRPRPNPDRRPTGGTEPVRRPPNRGDSDRSRPDQAAHHRTDPAKRAANSRRNPPRRRRNYGGPLALLLVLIVLGGVLLFAVKSCTGPDQGVLGTENVQPPVDSTGTSQETENPQTQPTVNPNEVVARATVLNTGDILMHKPVINTGLSGGTYNFDSIFTYAKSYISGADYAVANLETTLAGLDNGYSYSGYPTFNCPDGIVDGTRDAGFDMLLTANNHSYDTSAVGLDRTVQIIREKGLATLGTMASADEKKYNVTEINGIRLGMVCYTYETADKDPDVPSLNTIPLKPQSIGKINSFDYDQLPKFYAALKQQIADMRKEGAEAIVVYLHWGDEYQLKQNSKQEKIAQELCNLGVDVIVGGHPHVVQPVDLLTSKNDDSHKTLVLYSMGNAVSNQRRNEMGQIKAALDGYTEDGVLFSFTFAKYADGTVALESTQLIPTWVNLRKGDRTAYHILPLDKNIGDWKGTFQISDSVCKQAEESYNRTMKIVGSGMEKAQTYLAQAKLQREQASAAQLAPAA